MRAFKMPAPPPGITAGQYRCAKCGSEMIAIEYDSFLDKLNCTCSTCSFKFAMPPKDSKQEDPNG